MVEYSLKIFEEWRRDAAEKKVPEPHPDMALLVLQILVANRAHPLADQQHDVDSLAHRWAAVWQQAKDGRKAISYDAMVVLVSAFLEAGDFTYARRALVDFCCPDDLGAHSNAWTLYVVSAMLRYADNFLLSDNNSSDQESKRDRRHRQLLAHRRWSPFLKEVEPPEAGTHAFSRIPVMTPIWNALKSYLAEHPSRSGPRDGDDLLGLWRDAGKFLRLINASASLSQTPSLRNAHMQIMPTDVLSLWLPGLYKALAQQQFGTMHDALLKGKDSKVRGHVGHPSSAISKTSASSRANEISLQNRKDSAPAAGSPELSSHGVDWSFLYHKPEDVARQTSFSISESVTGTSPSHEADVSFRSASLGNVPGELQNRAYVEWFMPPALSREGFPRAQQDFHQLRTLAPLRAWMLVEAGPLGSLNLNRLDALMEGKWLHLARSLARGDETSAIRVEKVLRLWQRHRRLHPSDPGMLIETKDVLQALAGNPRAPAHCLRFILGMIDSAGIQPLASDQSRLQDSVAARGLTALKISVLLFVEVFRRISRLGDWPTACFALEVYGRVKEGLALRPDMSKDVSTISMAVAVYSGLLFGEWKSEQSDVEKLLLQEQILLESVFAVRKADRGGDGNRKATQHFSSRIKEEILLFLASGNFEKAPWLYEHLRRWAACVYFGAELELLKFAATKPHGELGKVTSSAAAERETILAPSDSPESELLIGAKARITLSLMGAARSVQAISDAASVHGASCHPATASAVVIAAIDEYNRARRSYHLDAASSSGTETATEGLLQRAIGMFHSQLKMRGPRREDSVAVAAIVQEMCKAGKISSAIDFVLEAGAVAGRDGAGVLIEHAVEQNRPNLLSLLNKRLIRSSVPVSGLGFAAALGRSLAADVGNVRLSPTDSDMSAGCAKDSTLPYPRSVAVIKAIQTTGKLCPLEPSVVLQCLEKLRQAGATALTPAFVSACSSSSLVSPIVSPTILRELYLAGDIHAGGEGFRAFTNAVFWNPWGDVCIKDIQVACAQELDRLASAVGLGIPPQVSLAFTMLSMSRRSSPAENVVGDRSEELLPWDSDDARAASPSGDAGPPIDEGVKGSASLLLALLAKDETQSRALLKDLVVAASGPCLDAIIALTHRQVDPKLALKLLDDLIVEHRSRSATQELSSIAGTSASDPLTPGMSTPSENVERGIDPSSLQALDQFFEEAFSKLAMSPRLGLHERRHAIARARTLRVLLHGAPRSLLIRELCDDRKPRVAFGEVQMWMEDWIQSGRRESFALTARSVGPCLVRWGKMGDWLMVAQTLLWMEEQRLVLEAGPLDGVFTAACAQDDSALAVGVLRVLQSAGGEPSEYAFAAAIALLARTGYCELAQGLVHEMKARGMEPGVGVANSLVFGVAMADATPARSLRLLSEFSQAFGIQPREDTFRSLLQAFSSKGDFKAVQDLAALARNQALSRESLRHFELVAHHWRGRHEALEQAWGDIHPSLDGDVAGARVGEDGVGRLLEAKESLAISAEWGVSDALDRSLHLLLALRTSGFWGDDAANIGGRNPVDRPSSAPNSAGHLRRYFEFYSDLTDAVCRGLLRTRRYSDLCRILCEPGLANNFVTPDLAARILVRLDGQADRLHGAEHADISRLSKLCRERLAGNAGLLGQIVK
jgi:hypothetical protein